MEILEREFAGRRAELRERHQAELAQRDAVIADMAEEITIKQGLLAQRLAHLALVQENQQLEAEHQIALAAAKARARQEAHAMCMAAGIEIPRNL